MKLTLLEHTSPSFCQRLKQHAPTKVFPQDFGRNAGKYILVLNSHANVSIYFTQQGGLGVEKNTASHLSSIYLIKEYKWNQPKLHLPAVADTISSHKNVDYLLTESCFLPLLYHF